MLKTPAKHLIEERALQAALAGRTKEAVRLLESGASEDPVLRWVAGMVALQAGDEGTAERLLTASEDTATWGQVEVLHARKKHAEAAKQALSAMDRALGTEHADALARTLIDWAKERSEKDPSNANRLLEAVLVFETSADVKKQAEDALFRLQGVTSSPEVVAAARRRLQASPGDVGACYVVGRRLSSSAVPAIQGWECLDRVAREGDHALAWDAVTLLRDAAAPPSRVLAATDALWRRFPGDESLTRLRFDVGLAVAAQDPRLQDDALLPLTEATPDALARKVRAVLDAAADIARTQREPRRGAARPQPKQ